MTKKMISLLLVIACANIAYATEFINFKRSSIYDVELTGTSDTITYDSLEWKGVRMAVENLRHDLKAVTGSANAPVVVGTIGKSKLVKKYKLQSKELQGKRQRMRSEIFDNLRWLSIDLDIPTEGNHTIKVVMIDPEIVVEKLVVNPDNEHPSYHGKE